MNTKPISKSQPVKETSNMKKLKTFLCFALAIASLLSLTACGDAKAPEKQPVTGPTSEPTIVIQETTEATIPDDKIAINPFDYFEIKFEDPSPNVVVHMTNSYDIDGHRIDFYIKNNAKMFYQNNETITITAKISNIVGGENKYILTENEKEFIVASNAWRVESADEITEENITAMKNMADELMNGDAKRIAGASGMTYESHELAKIELWVLSTEYSSEHTNRVMFFYKVDGTDKKEGSAVTKYACIRFYNIINHIDGSQNVDLKNFYIDEILYPALEEMKFDLSAGNPDKYTITKVNFD